MLADRQAQQGQQQPVDKDVMPVSLSQLMAESPIVRMRVDNAEEIIKLLEDIK